MQVTTQAIVLSSIKYSDADLIVKCFTRSSGIKSYLLKNILKSKKGKLRTSLFQPLTLLEIQANHKDKGTLEFIQEAKIYHPYNSLHTHIIKTSVVLFLSEVLKSTIQEEEPNLPLFDYLESSFIWLDQHDSIANFHLLFLINLTDYLGFYPDSSTTEYPVFNILEGVFQNGKSNIYCVEVPENTGVKQLLGINFDALGSVNFTNKQRRENLDILLLYYQLHIQGFQKPRSLAVLNQLF